jgi:hypothetical protein
MKLFEIIELLRSNAVRRIAGKSDDGSYRHGNAMGGVSLSFLMLRNEPSYQP